MGCIAKIKLFGFRQIWLPVLEARAIEVAIELPLSERLKKWEFKDD